MIFISAYDFMNNDCTMDTKCQHCGHIHKDTSAYNDAYYRNEVIPSRYCPSCGLNGKGETKPVEPKTT